MDVVIPIYNPSSYRLSNLKFILDEMCSQHIQNVYVCEQGNNTTDVKQLVDNYGFANHHEIIINTDRFNKSKLINIAVSKTSSDLIWLLDGDVYLNYKYVQTHTPDYIDFLRPFDKIVLLGEQETADLKETSRIKLSDRQYDSYQGYGKYSMIVRRSLFDSIGGFDERYEGWGFQDLDFVKKIPASANKGHTDNLGFHLFHDRQPLSNYSDNKKIYTELTERTKLKRELPKQSAPVKKQEEEYYEKEVPPPVIKKPIPTKPKTTPPPPPPPPPQTKSIRPWPRPTHIYINKTKVGVSLATRISNWGSVYMVDISKPTSVSRTLRGTTRTKNIRDTPVVYFLKFLIKTYDELDKSSVVIYMTDALDLDVIEKKTHTLKQFNRSKVELNVDVGVTKLHNMILLLVVN